MLFGIIVLIILLKYFYLTITGYIKNSNRNKSKIPDVKVETVREKLLTKTFEVPARVVSKYQVGIKARISGYLEKSYFKEGDFVNEGEVLFLIEPLEFQNATDVAKSNIVNIQAQLDYANKQLERAQELVVKGYIAKSKYDETLAQRDMLQAQLDGAKSSYRDSTRNLKYTQVKAPVCGRVGTIDITVGNFVSQNSGNLTTVYSINPIYVTFALKASDYDFLSSYDKGKQNHKVELYYQNGNKYQYDGIQDFTDNKIDQTTDSVTLRATFQNPDNKLLHGEFMNIKLFMNSKVKIPLVPVSAVLSNQEGKYVFILDKQNIPYLQYIKTQSQEGNYWIVTHGIKKGARIVTDGIQHVIPGQKVNIIN